MRITFRTVLILLFISVLIMAYCSTTVDAGILSKHKHRAHSKGSVRSTYKVKTKHKTKTKTKIRYGHKKPSLIKRVG
jgi:outer membrane lipoprotein-sorting protein